MSKYPGTKISERLNACETKVSVKQLFTHFKLKI